MKVLAIDLTSLADHFSGIERYAASVSLALISNSSIEYKYILIFKGEIHESFVSLKEEKNISFVVIPRGRGDKLYFSQVRLPCVLRRLEADLVLFLAFPAPMLFFGAAVSTIHDLSCFDCPETMTVKSRILWRVLNAKAVRHDKLIVTISHFSKSRIVDHFGISEEKVVVAYCGVEKQLFNLDRASSVDLGVLSKKYGLPQNYILSLSTIEPRKNLQLLIRAWCNLRIAGDIDCDLVLAGRKGWKIASLLDNLPDDCLEHIHFTGFVNDEDLPALYKGSRLFVFPSIYEGFGLPPVEAVNSGARVLCSDIPCHREICNTAVSYFVNNDEGSLRREISSILASENNAVNRSLEYCWDHAALAIVNHLNILGL